MVLNRYYLTIAFFLVPQSTCYVYRVPAPEFKLLLSHGKTNSTYLHLFHSLWRHSHLLQEMEMLEKFPSPKFWKIKSFKSMSFYVVLGTCWMNCSSGYTGCLSVSRHNLRSGFWPSMPFMIQGQDIWETISFCITRPVHWSHIERALLVVSLLMEVKGLAARNRVPFPVELRSTASLETFWQGLKTFLFSMAFWLNAEDTLDMIWLLTQLVPVTCWSNCGFLKNWYFIVTWYFNGYGHFECPYGEKGGIKTH